MIEEIEYKGKKYPSFHAVGFRSKYIFPIALEVCKGIGYDIGCGSKDWALPGSIPIDINFGNEWNALNLPAAPADYIFSSHCLEHLDNWVEALNYWISCIKSGGTLFLYLPHYDQEYWRPWNNLKHKHVLTTQIIVDMLTATNKLHKIYFGDRDINYSFCVMGEKI